MAAISRISVEGRDRRCCVSGLLIAPLRRLDFLRRPLAIRCIRGHALLGRGALDQGTKAPANGAHKGRARVSREGARFLTWPNCNTWENSCALPKLQLEKALWFSEHRLSGGMRPAPIAVGGVSGGYGDDDRDRTFLW